MHMLKARVQPNIERVSRKNTGDPIREKIGGISALFYNGYLSSLPLIVPGSFSLLKSPVLVLVET